jgi:NTE family protein
MFRKTLSFLVICLLFCHSAVAQKVGVVLSGGGAKGLYHIGVLQALEENQVPIDYIAGTSMGAIIAGLYASGYSPAEMREIVASGEVEKWVSGKIDRKYRHYFREMNEQPSMLSVRVNIKGKQRGEKVVQMPSHIISSSQIDMAIVGLFQPASVASGGDFDKLMIPFRCVAADMNTRTAKVFDSGDLGIAIRSSMSIPMVFKPLQLDSLLLYDGGLIDNFPWRTLEKDFAPDVFIGSKCTAGIAPVDINSDVVSQALMLMTTKTDYSLPEERGIMLDRAVDVGMLDFHRGLDVVDQGYTDALERMPEILKRVTSRRSVEEVAIRRESFRKRMPKVVYGGYRADSISSSQQFYVEHVMRLKDGNGKVDTLSHEELNDRLNDLLVDDKFECDYPMVSYDVESRKFTIGMNLKARPLLRFSFGGNISSTAFNQALISAKYETIGRVSQSASIDLYLGAICNMGRIGGRTTLYQKIPIFFDYSYNFGVMNTLYGNFGHLVGVDNTERIKTKEQYGSVSAGFALTRKSVLQFVVNGGEDLYRKADWDDYTRFTFIGSKLEFKRSTLDHRIFPTKGTNLNLSGIYIYGQDKYQYMEESTFLKNSKMLRKEWFGAKLRWEQYFEMPLIKWFALGYRLDGVYTNHPKFESAPTTIMSSPLYAPVPHANMIYMPDFRAAKYAAVGVMPTFKIVDNLMVRAGFYTMFRDKSYTSSHWHYIADLSVVYHTPLGPVSLALTKYDLQSWQNMYLSFNFGLLIFSPKGLFY